MKNILITGGAGFVGSNFVKYMIEKYGEKYNYIVYDKLSYAANMDNLKGLENQYVFVKGDICNLGQNIETIKKYNIDAVVNFAAESHVDNSINNPLLFTTNNVVGAHCLLEACRQVWKEQKTENRFIQISTDEVYGALRTEGSFTELSQLKPNSPYSASKVASDAIVRSYYKTYGMNVGIVRPSNNYGPNQFEEKLIPLMVKKAINNEKLPVYGTGENIRDWLYVMDNCAAIDTVLNNGKKGVIYNIGSNNEKTNLEIVRTILRVLDKPETLIQYVEDRKGHDFRYSIDASKIRNELGWKPGKSFEEGIIETIEFYKNKFESKED